MKHKALYNIFPSISIPRVIFLFLVVAVLSIFLRVQYFSDSPFPINDGGLFYVYTSTIFDNNLSLPRKIDFNGFSLPFAYPPFSFWLAAFISSLFGLELLNVVKYYPFIVHLFFLALYIPFLRSLRLPWSAVVLASTVLFLSHRSFEYLIMGGGMSRATGAVFTLAALIFSIRNVNRSSILGTVATSSFCALSILSHLEWGIVSALGVTLIILFHGDQLYGKIKQLLITGLITALMIAPWVIWIVCHHGVAPFLYASETSYWGFEKILLSIFRLDIFPWYLKILCVIGVWESLKNKEYFWITFTISLVFLTPRHFHTAAVISNSVLAAVGIIYAWQLSNSIGERIIHSLRIQSKLFHNMRENIYLMLVMLVACFTVSASYYDLGNSSMGTLSDEAYDAMRWIRANVKPEATFVVVSPDPWYIDEVNEWFPVFTGAISLTTVQGTEWVPNGEFRKRSNQVGRLKGIPCQYVAEEIIGRFYEANYAMATTRRDCLNKNKVFIPLYDNSGASVYLIKKD